MPQGQVNILKSRQDFFDVVRYLIEISEGGEEVAKKLAPSKEELLAMLSGQETNLDHSGFISDWNKDGQMRISLFISDEWHCSRWSVKFLDLEMFRSPNSSSLSWRRYSEDSALGYRYKIAAIILLRCIFHGGER